MGARLSGKPVVLCSRYDYSGARARRSKGRILQRGVLRVPRRRAVRIRLAGPDLAHHLDLEAAHRSLRAQLAARALGALARHLAGTPSDARPDTARARPARGRGSVLPGLCAPELIAPPGNAYSGTKARGPLIFPYGAIRYWRGGQG